MYKNLYLTDSKGQQRKSGKQQQNLLGISPSSSKNDIGNFLLSVLLVMAQFLINTCA